MNLSNHYTIQRLNIKTIFITAFLLTTPSLSFGEITYGKCNDYTCEITIDGEITQASLKEINRATTSKMKFLTLNSPGGDMGAALQIARNLRKGEPYWAFVKQGSVCYSSCVLLLAGAGVREVNGKVGIHRPYNTNNQKDRSITEIQNEQKKIATFVKEFLAEVNVNVSLYDDMMGVPPHKIKVLSQEQLEHYGLANDAPDVEQSENERLAREIGISMPELLNRKAVADRKCRGDLQCKTATLVGITKQELLARGDKATGICSKLELEKMAACITAVMYRNATSYK